MFNKIILYLKNFDWILFAAVLLLVCFGLVEIYSITLGQGAIDLFNFKKQIFFVIVGLILLFVFAFLNYHSLRSYSNYFYLLGIILLVAVLFFGQTIRGAQSWFYLAGFGLQPIEFVKLILILFLARYFSSIAFKIRPIKHLAITGGGVAVLIILVLLQPDFGSASILFLLWFFMVILAGFKKKYFIAVTLILLILMGASWAFLFEDYQKDYQKERIITFLNPSHDPLVRGYNITQTIIAIGAGGFAGRGLGFGSQSQLKFLPEAQTDFIFAVIAEELGLLGVILVLLFFTIFFHRCLASLKKIDDDFAVFFILAAVSLIFIEMFVNISMNAGLLPIIGISLPFLSYGGSAMLSNLILVGVIESIIIRSKINY
ncbi:MAG: rod shape-determining protein RodA [Patescibacteria group bacterium]|nr:rod shape-determining protein RodA [Patescibacteria group bacterium]